MKRALLFAALLVGLSPPLARAERIVVFAAASLSGVLEQIAGETDIVFSYGGSGAIARQIAAGAPADAVILANPRWMEWLVEHNAVDPEALRIVARNSLVVIGPKGTPPAQDTSELIATLGTGRLAMGQRDAVPAGSYTRQWLQSRQLWDQVSGQLAETDNVRAALALVVRGQVALGVVYASDAAAEPAVDIVYTIAPQTHDPVLYPAAALTPAGAAFIDRLNTRESIQRFLDAGFQRPFE